GRTRRAPRPRPTGGARARSGARRAAPGAAPRPGAHAAWPRAPPTPARDPHLPGALIRWEFQVLGPTSPAAIVAGPLSYDNRRPRLAQVIICKKCGNHNEDGVEFCAACGALREWSGERVGQPDVEPPRPEPDPEPKPEP